MNTELAKKLIPLEQNLGYKFKDIFLLVQAMTHKSYANERFPNTPTEIRDNERFEFLGDSVLSLVITDIIMEQFPNSQEGVLSRLRASVVNETRLAEIAQLLKLQDYILLGKGEEQTGGRNKNSILANTFEAIVCAIYQDGGLEEAFNFISKQFGEILNKAKKEDINQDFKTKLQEYMQKKHKKAPSYHLINEFGPDHDKTFQVEILFNKNRLGLGVGKSKKEAEQEAARRALNQVSP
jgi:ribonuclease III